MAEIGKKSTVTVACSLPNGFVMQCTESRMETPPQGGKDVAIHYRTGETVTIAGANAGHPEGSNPTGRKVFNYGLTEVDADLWAKWLEQHAKWAPVVNGFVFATGTPDKSADRAKEQAGVRTGMEQLDPDKPAPGIEKV